MLLLWRLKAQANASLSQLNVSLSGTTIFFLVVVVGVLVHKLGGGLFFGFCFLFGLWVWVCWVVVVVVEAIFSMLLVGCLERL